MIKVYVIIDFDYGNYYCGVRGWLDNPYYAVVYEYIEQAEAHIRTLQGRFKIETLYIN